MDRGDRVIVDGQDSGVVVAVDRTAGMVDIQLDAGFTVRKHRSRVENMARRNPEKPTRTWRQDLRPSAETLSELAAQSAAEEARVKKLKRETGHVRKRETAKYERQDRKAKYDRSTVDMQLKKTGAAFYIANDPPRLSESGRTYCGNPIDGTAYYLLITNQTTTAGGAHMLTVQEVEDAGGLEEAARKFGGPKAQPIPRPWQFFEQYIKDRSTGPKEQVDPKYAWVKHGRGLAQLPITGTGDPTQDAYYDGNYYVVYGSRRALQRAILETFFSPYKLFSIGPVPQKMKFSSFVAMNDDIALSPDVWKLFLRSGGVSVTAERSRSNATGVSDWNQEIAQGSYITVGFANKSGNPFFSWVHTVEPIYADPNRLPPCQDDEDLLQARALTRAAGQFSGADRLFSRIANLFRHQADDTEAGRLRAVESTWKFAGSELARFANWHKTMTEKADKGDVTAKALLSMASAKGLDETLIRRAWLMRLISYPAKGSRGPLEFNIEWIGKGKKRDGVPRAVPSEGQSWFWVPYYDRGAVFEMPTSEAPYLNLTTGPSFIANVMAAVAALLSDPRLQGKPYAAIWEWLSGKESSLHAWAHFLQAAGVADDPNVTEEDIEEWTQQWLGDPNYLLTELRERYTNQPHVYDALEVLAEVRWSLTQGGSMEVVQDSDAWQRKHAQQVMAHRRDLERRGYSGYALRLKMGEYETSEATQRVKLAQSLLFLAALYDLLDGVKIRGRLTADPEYLRTQGPLQSSIERMRATRDRLRYGEIDNNDGLLNVGAQIATYKTYNPILFKATQELWPTTRSAIGVGEDAGLMRHIDAVGRYGAMLAYLQFTFMTAKSEQAALKSLRDLSVSAVTHARSAGTLTNITQRKGHPHFGVMWGLGQSPTETAKGLQALAADPQGFVAVERKSFTGELFKPVARPMKKMAERGKGSAIIAEVIAGQRVIDPQVTLTRTEKWVLDRALTEMNRLTGESSVRIDGRDVPVVRVSGSRLPFAAVTKALVAGPMQASVLQIRVGGAAEEALKKLAAQGFVHLTRERSGSRTVVVADLAVPRGASPEERKAYAHKAVVTNAPKGDAQWIDELIPAYIQSFQRRARIPVTGVIDASTMGQLKSLSEGAYQPAEALPMLSVLPSRGSDLVGRVEEQERRLKAIQAALKSL